jgi:hypothetical protein
MLAFCEEIVSAVSFMSTSERPEQGFPHRTTFLHGIIGSASIEAKMIRKPIAPPVYRPQQLTRSIQQKSGSTQPPHMRHAPRRPVAPPVYRPDARKTVQPKAASQPRQSPKVPPVYRPERTRTAQPTTASAANAQVQPKTPPVYRPQFNQANAGSGRPAQMSRHQPAASVPVIQRMENPNKETTFGYKIGSFFAPKIAWLLNVPNIFAMSQFTSCICLVFNRAGLAIDEVMAISGDYRKTFEDVKKNWEAGGKDRRFVAMCPYAEDGTFSDQFRSFSMSCAMAPDALGSNPLIVVIGHCSPGSSSISGDEETDLSFSVYQVLDVIRPLMIKNCTIMLTPCSTAVKTSESLSFQDHLINAMAKQQGLPAYVVGMNSTSVPIGGTVLSTGYTYKHSTGGEITFEEFKIHQEKRPKQ